MSKSDDYRLVLFGEYETDAEAYITKGVLESNGIPCVIHNELMANIYPVAPMSLGLRRLMVRACDLEQAKATMLSDAEERNQPETTL